MAYDEPVMGKTTVIVVIKSMYSIKRLDHSLITNRTQAINCNIYNNDRNM